MSHNSERRLSQASTVADFGTTPTPTDNILPDPNDPRIIACQNGDIATLKNLDITAPSWHLINRMFDAAASNAQVQTIQFLSARFPSHKGAGDAAFYRKDPATLRAVLTHDPSMVWKEDDYSSYMYLFCQGSDPTLALIMLEFGADPTLEAQPKYLNIPLDAAVKQQPMVLIEKLIQRGCVVTDTTIWHARVAGRDDVVQYLEEMREGGSKRRRTDRKRCVLQ